MKFPKIVTGNPVKIEKLVPGGQGIATTKEGIKGFFWNALPGETVTEYEITKKKSHYFEAVALKIENPSDRRIEPKDSCYLSTSPWQILSYDFELEQKALLLEEVFYQHGIASEVNAFSDDVLPANEKMFIPDDPDGFARRAVPPAVQRMTARRSERHQKASFLVSEQGGAEGRRPTFSSETGATEKAFTSLAVVTDDKDFFYRNKMEYSLYYDYEDNKLHLGFHLRGTHRKIKVETSSIERPEIFEKAQEIVNDLNEKHADGRNYQSLLLRCNQNGEVEGGLYENRKPHPVFKNLTDTVLGKTYSYSPNGFFQINLPVYEMALQEIKKHIKTENVLDLYAGVGTIGLSVASDKHLTLVEVDKPAYAERERNWTQVKASDGKPLSDDVLPAIEKMCIPDDPDGFAR
ncbi:RsmD family RNA methyltransferase, partial [Candidatus Saccharibacteria bacterium]|nr:RsmD family RNA methyltransferase [Candidatus Saccharibacteria bacterium]